MAKIRPPDKPELAPTLKMMSSSLGSTSSYSSSLDSHRDTDRLYDDLEDMINSIRNLEVEDDDDGDDDEDDEKAKIASSDDESSGEDDDDDDLVERGPLRPQFQNRANKPYLDAAAAPAHWQEDYDTSAKAILTDNEYRQKIDLCLNVLSSGGDSPLSPASGYSPPQQQASYPDQSPSGVGSSKSFVPSITVCDSESSLLEILSRGGFQAAQSQQTTPDHWPDSPASNASNACATSASRPDSRASSRAQSPGSINGCPPLLNVLGSPIGSPQVSPQAFRNLPRPSSSSSSSQSYCETPSPANYQNPLDQHSEEQLGENMLSRLPAWRESFESTDTLVNSSELHLQLVEEVILGDMSKPRPGFLEPGCAVPDCAVPGCAVPGGPEADDLTNSLLRFVGSDQARKVEPRCSPATSGYSSSSSCGDAMKHCDPMFLDGSRQPVYQPQCANVENFQFPTTPIELLSRNSWPNYGESSPIAPSSTQSSSPFSNFQVPESVTSFNSHRQKSKDKDDGRGSRSIAPWPSLNLPSTRAASRLKEMTDPREVEKAMKTLLKTPTERLTRVDQDGDTMLMCLTGNPSELQKKLAYLAPLVERMGTIDGSLSTINNQGKDALYLACMMCPRMAFVAGYLAATFLQKNIDIGQSLYQPKGETLIHALAAKGDAHGEVLAELLSLKTARGNPVFDLSRHDYDGKTPLHVAVDAHESMDQGTKIVSLGSTRLLLEMGADPTIREPKGGNTALHAAIALNADPALIKILMTVGRGPEAVHLANYNGDTPLHLAASMSERMNLDRQLETCWQLIHSGARTNVTNRAGKMPLALASPDRRESLRRLFHKKC